MATRREELELAIKKAMDAESIANCKVIGTARAIATLGPTAYLLSGLRADTEEQQRAEEEVSKAHAAYMAELAGAAQPTPEQIEEQRTQLRGRLDPGPGHAGEAAAARRGVPEGRAG